jgi:RNA polymerase sigma factor (sigma-70 family)
MLDINELTSYRATLLAYASRRVTNGEAEDLVQDTFIKAIRFQNSFDGTNLGGWLMAILQNTIKSYWRVTNRVLVNDSLEELTEDEINTTALSYEDDYVQGVFGDGALGQAVSGLPVEFQRVLVLSYKYRLPDGEIASLLGVAPNTIATRRKRAQARIKKVLVEVGA